MEDTSSSGGTLAMDGTLSGSTRWPLTCTTQEISSLTFSERETISIEWGIWPYYLAKPPTLFLAAGAWCL